MPNASPATPPTTDRRAADTSHASEAATDGAPGVLPGLHPPPLLLPGGLTAIATGPRPPRRTGPIGPQRSMWRPILAAAIAVWCIGTAAFAFGTHAAPGLNDVWNLVALGDRVVWTDPATWRNGFYPFGTPLVFAALQAAPPMAGPMALAWCSASLLLWLVARRGRAEGGERGAAMAMLFLMVSPWFAVYALTQTTDMLTALLLGGGVLVATARGEAPTIRRGLLAGLLLGGAVALRLHALAFALPFGLFWLSMITHALFDEDLPEPHRRAAAPLAAMVAAFAGVQVAVNLADGYPPFHTHQSFNVYKAIHGVEWLRTSELTDLPRVGDMLRESPWGALRAIGVAAFGQLVLALPAWWGGWILGRYDEERSAVWRGLACAVFVYAIASAFGDSTRASLLILPLNAIVVASLVSTPIPKARPPGTLVPMHVLTWKVWDQRRPGLSQAMMTPGFAAGVCIAMGFASWLQLSAEWGRRTQIRERNAQIEMVLGSVTPREVWSNDFSLYLPNTPPHRIVHNGGWARIDLRGHNERYPELCLTSWACFTDSAREHGISRVVLCPSGEILRLPVVALAPDAEGLTEPREVAGCTVYRVQSADSD